jgi:hypothetical protein
VSYHPERVEEDQQRAREQVSAWLERGEITQEELVASMVPIEHLEPSQTAYTIVDDLIAGFRQCGWWLLAVHAALLLLSQTRWVEAAVVTLAAACVAAIAFPWPNPSLAMAGALMAYVALDRFIKSARTRRLDGPR